MGFQNPETSSSSASTASFFSLPPCNLKKTTASNVEYLYEINHISEELNIQDAIARGRLPSLNPYKAFTNTFTSFFKSAKTFFNSLRRSSENYIEVTRFEEHPIPSGEQESFITLQIPPECIRQWVAQGCKYIHFGAIRLGLTFHGRERFPGAARIALLDSRLLKYQQGCLAIVETTLNGGTIFVTVFPYYQMSLQDGNLSTAFQVHLQIVGAPMETGLSQATLHSQMVYRVQHRWIDLSKYQYRCVDPHGRIPLIQVDSQNKTIATQLPANISREEFVSILSETWVTNFENRQTIEQPIHASDSKDTQNSDGTVTVRFNCKRK